MTNTFFDEAKTLISLFIKENRESIIWFAAELKRQYHLSILKEIASTYPETQLHINKTCDIVDGLPEDCPDFVEAPEDYDEKHQLIQDVQDSLLAFAKYKFPDIDFVGYIATVTMEKQETETDKIHPF